MKTVLFLALALTMGGCAAETDDESSGEDTLQDSGIPSDQDSKTCPTGEDCGSDTPGGDAGPAGGTCLAGEECGSDTPDQGTADPFATCLEGEECGSDTPDDLENPLP